MISIRRFFTDLKETWLDKRIPASKQYRFDVKNTFILPTKFGWILVSVAIFLFILGTNYQNNLVLLLSFFCFSLILLSLFHSFYFFTRLSIAFEHNDELFANQAAYLNIKVINRHRLDSARLYYQHEYSRHSTNTDRRGRSQQSIVRTLSLSSATQSHQLVIGQLSRGKHKLPRITFFATYPFGLFKTWSHLAISTELLIYPEPKYCSTQLFVSSKEGKQSENYSYESSSSEELQGVRDYRDEDPIHHVSWKHVAKGQGMLSKEFAAHGSQTSILDIKRVTADTLEDKLSQLCHSILTLSQNNQHFGLEIYNQSILPNSGEKHRKQCLEVLANLRSESDRTSKVSRC